MSPTSDFSYEMPGDPPVDDAPAPFAEEVRFAVSGPPPVPSPALAEVLTAGFSNPTEKGDLPVTAGSNVHGPARQAAGLPNWKKERDMAVPGVVAGLLAKLAGAGTAAKAALATATAVTTLGLAGGAAGMLPDPAQDVVAAAVGAATPFEFPDADEVTGTIGQALPSLPQVDVTVPTIPNLPVQPPVSVAGGVKAGSSNASASATTPAVTPTIPNVTVPNLPQVTIPPAVSGLVNGLPACVKDLIPAAGSVPNPTTLVTKIQACIPQVLNTANVPPEVKACVSSVLGTIGGASGLNASAIPGLGSFNLSACVPMDMSRCVTNMMGFLGTIPGLSGGQIPGFGSISNLPGLSTISGCVPMDLNRCITSITSAATAGAVPRFDLSACMPTTLPGTGMIPSFGSFSNLPGLGGALPFFGIFSR